MTVDVGVVGKDAFLPFTDTAVEQGAGNVSGQPRRSSIDRSADVGLGTESNLAGSLVPDSADVGEEGEVLLRIGSDGVNDTLAVREGSVGGLW